MPYIEGKTLKQIIRKKASVSSLTRIFLSVCQAIAYAHAKGILHRDLKPENIIAGTYGEVLLLDWGLADYIGVEPSLEEVPLKENGLTIPGKVVGTLAYMAPERILGEDASILTDIYALGVVLYEILTLKLPFKRTTIENFKKSGKHEILIPPLEAAPYRDIPQMLSHIAEKCLKISKKERYQSVSELIIDLQKYIEGKPEWIFSEALNTHHKKDWEFQENILLAKHIAITQGTDVMEWVNLMISKSSFSENMKLETSVKILPKGKGIGFLLSIPDASQRKNFEEGYSLWLGSSTQKGVILYRSNVEVFHLPEIYLEENKEVKITIKKRDNHLRVFLDDKLTLNYLSLLPFFGNQIGVLSRDAHFEIKPLSIFVGSTNIMVKCLAVPDAFLASKYYDKALSEYRRIKHSFLGRSEGREAIFKAGITLIEQAKEGKNELFQEALNEFGELACTPSAPLEYLGKSLVYKEQKDIEEEAKCLELALRKYPKHPLIFLLEEHIALRLHEASYHNRIETYHLALICLRHLPHIFAKPEHLTILTSLKSHWEPLPFLKEIDEECHFTDFAIRLAFWLAKPAVIEEILETLEDKENGIAALKELQTLSYTPYPEIETLLEQNKWKEASAIFKNYPIEKLRDDKSPLFALYGCYLAATEGEQQALTHFAWGRDSYPKTPALLAHFLQGKISLEDKDLFLWEKIMLLKELALFYHCLSNEKQSQFYKERIQTLH